MQYPSIPVLNQSSYRLLFAQFQTRYPQGALHSELLQIHQDQYIVRVAIESDGIILSTGMAAAKDIEAAENQARLRALELLGIYAPTAGVLPEFSSPPPAPSFIPSSANSTLAPISTTTLGVEPLSNSFTEPDEPPLEIEDMAEYEERSYFQSETISPAVDVPLEDPIPWDSIESSSNISAETVSSKVNQADAVTLPIDMSDVIAQTTVEIKRLRWTDVQGRDHLKRTYGKRSRQHLTDEELMEFLSYLKGQPTPD